MFKWFQKKLVSWLTYEAPLQGSPLCDFDRILYEVKPCDVLLIEGRSIVSDVIKQISQSAWTHSCLYIGRVHDIEDEILKNKLMQHYKGPPNKQLIVESLLGQGLICSPLETYKGYHIRISRPRNLSRKDANTVLAYLINRLGSGYVVRQLYDMWRFFVPWSIFPRRWRSSLFTNPKSQSARTVCSTVIAEAFQEVEFPILPIIKIKKDNTIELYQRNPRMLAPKDFDYSPYFDIIKYPYTEFMDNEFYHTLPWNKDGVLINEAPGQYGMEEEPKGERQ
jgi:hypothetical protein